MEPFPGGTLREALAVPLANVKLLGPLGKGSANRVVHAASFAQTVSACYCFRMHSAGPGWHFLHLFTFRMGLAAKDSSSLDCGIQKAQAKG